MEPLEFLLGVLTFNVAMKFKKPMRKVAVIAATQVIGVVDKVKTTAFELKEEFEDIVAEAQYENMQKKLEVMETTQENTENTNVHE